jgi:hypothetical protein
VRDGSVGVAEDLFALVAELELVKTDWLSQRVTESESSQARQDPAALSEFAMA